MYTTCLWPLPYATQASLTGYYPLDMYRAEQSTDTSKDAICAQWVAAAVDGDGWGTMPADAQARWHDPSPAELAFAEDVLRTFGEAPAEEISKAAAGGLAIEKDTLRVLILKIEGILAGARSCIPEFDGVSASAGRADGSVQGILVGGIGAPVGDGRTRERLAAALVAAVGLASADDIECLQVVARCADDLLNRGHREYIDQGQASLAWRSDAISLTQPRRAGVPGGAVVAFSLSS